MTYRSILVPVDGARDNSAVLDVALDLAITFGAHVEALYVRADARDSLPLFGEGLSGDMVEDMIITAERDSTARALAHKAAFETQCAGKDVPCVSGSQRNPAGSASWRDMTGREDDVVAWRSRLADLVITARPGDDSSSMRASTLRAALFAGGRPVLLLPDHPAVTTVGRTVAIAWNGTAEAARAVHGALAFITRAADVHVLTCETLRTNPTPGDELADYLRGWGVSAKVIGFPPSQDSVGANILAQAQAVQADVLVCGAYSHSRLMQMVLGGVTSTLMESAEIPVLFSH